jgi:penicillin-binding protein 2
MYRWLRKLFYRYENQDIAPDEIFLDDRNMPEFDEQQFEGRIEQPIKRRTVVLVALAFLTVGVVFSYRAGVLQVREGSAYAEKSENNRLDHQYLFPERGIITDRNGKQLAWNVPSVGETDYSLRAYTETPGFGHLLGFLHYPAKDKSGVYYRNDYEASVGVESSYNELLKGKKGLRIIETDALGRSVSENVIDPPIPGETLTLSIDARLQEKLYEHIKQVANEHDFRGGAGGIIDIHTGELLALTSFPEYDSNVMTNATDRNAIAEYNSDIRTPFLNRAISGVYTPGSIVKPIYAAGALNEGLVVPSTQILSTGSISIPNPYFPDKESVFNDWKAHGWLDMEHAIAWSSDVYFYEIGGGYKTQRGLGIKGLEKYARMFGFGTTTGIDLGGEEQGTIPNPAWKEKNFDGDQWRIGDTYFTAIGQYGMQITPIQAIKEASIIGSRGLVVTPTVVKGAATSTTRIPIPESYFNTLHDGMRIGVTEGTAKRLDVPYVKIAAKTGTAELGVSKSHWNSWVLGFFPYMKPRYAFAIVMGRGPKGNSYNAAYVAQQFFIDVGENYPEFLGNSPKKPVLPTLEEILDSAHATTTEAESASSTGPTLIEEVPVSPVE